jgi:hypothetical protein
MNRGRVVGQIFRRRGLVVLVRGRGVGEWNCARKGRRRRVNGALFGGASSGRTLNNSSRSSSPTRTFME